MARKVRKVQREDSIVFDYDGLSNIKEQYNRLKDNILYFAVDGKNVIQVESTVSSEGKTTTFQAGSPEKGSPDPKTAESDKKGWWSRTAPAPPAPFPLRIPGF